MNNFYYGYCCLPANHYCGAFTFLVLYTTSSMRSGSSLCPFFSVRRRSADPSRSVLPSSSPSVLLLSASHRCSPGRRSDLLRLRSVLGGSVVLAVVGLGLRAAALAVAVAAHYSPQLLRLAPPSLQHDALAEPEPEPLCTLLGWHRDIAI